MGKDIFATAKEMLTQAQEAAAQESPIPASTGINRGGRGCEPGQSKSERRRNIRLRMLRKFAPDRRCPKCGVIKTGSRQWVVHMPKTGVGYAVCKQCDQSNKLQE